LVSEKIKEVGGSGIDRGCGTLPAPRKELEIAAGKAGGNPEMKEKMGSLG
jgi:hypothetical protein